ncbi:phage head closure protein [Pseudoponticoccus marisrubri]|uniref:Head-tail adaptor protein n=1 Tax=Pseudoponticoccus marisrubri TaxID=1685382 RepID=A0A0W7WP76_9RHOB|nr:phage head closure protein [Pseudoponticoccus marisrubri]KUF12405.1 hypothetical protein AVJ23_01350 [Pseudoponticoccus marisrubri]
MIPAGKLDRSIKIERQTETVAASGAVSKAWAPVVTLRAQVLTASTEERLHGFGALDSDVTVFRVRWRNDLKNSDRIIFDGTAYEIDRITEQGRRAALDLYGKAIT